MKLMPSSSQEAKLRVPARLLRLTSETTYGPALHHGLIAIDPASASPVEATGRGYSGQSPSMPHLPGQMISPRTLSPGSRQSLPSSLIMSFGSERVVCPCIRRNELSIRVLADTPGAQPHSNRQSAIWACALALPTDQDQKCTDAKEGLS